MTFSIMACNRMTLSGKTQQTHSQHNDTQHTVLITVINVVIKEHSYYKSIPEVCAINVI